MALPECLVANLHLLLLPVWTQGWLELVRPCQVRDRQEQSILPNASGWTDAPPHPKREAITRIYVGLVGIERRAVRVVKVALGLEHEEVLEAGRVSVQGIDVGDEDSVLGEGYAAVVYVGAGGGTQAGGRDRAHAQYLLDHSAAVGHLVLV